MRNLGEGGSGMENLHKSGIPEMAIPSIKPREKEISLGKIRKHGN